MPNTDWGTLINAAAQNGVLNLTAGTLTVDPAHDDAFTQRLREVLGADASGHVKLNEVVKERRKEDREEREVATGELLKRQQQARLAAVKAQLERAWTRMGGPHAPVGLPLGGEIKVKQAGPSTSPTYSADFRGGTIHLSNNGDIGGTDEQTKVYIDLVGIECQVRQEGTDEIYAIVSVIGPSDHSIVSVRVPADGTIDMGPDGMRISLPVTRILTSGNVEDYYVWVAFIENDSGDVDVIAKKVADKVASYTATALAGASGVPAESIAESESFKENLITGLAWVFGDVLGMGDDPYNPEAFPLFWADLKANALPLQPPYKRDDDPRTITSWTHKTIVSGVDDGGDHGQYALYFRVWVQQEPRHYEAPTKP